MLQLRIIRYGGVAAAGLLAVSAGLGGALPHGDLASTPVSVFRGPHGGLVLAAWLVGTVGLSYAWWVARDRMPSSRWAVVTALLWSAPFLLVPPMGSRDVYSYACQGHLFLNGLSPYQYGVATLPCPWIDAVSPIWRDTAAPYGPLFVLLAAGAVWLGGSLAGVVTLFRLVAAIGVITIAVCLPFLARRCGVPAERALWLALAGPVVGPHIIGGPHNDALMIALVVAGLALTAGSERPAARLGAGVLLGLAAAVKITSVVILPFAALIALRQVTGRGPAVGAATRLLAAASGAFIAVTAASGLGIGWTAGLVHTRDLVQFTSPPTAIGMTLTYVGQGFTSRFDAVPAVRVLALGLLAVVLAGLWLRCAREVDNAVPAALHGAALAVAATVVLAPSVHPWYVFAPLVLLAATTHRTVPVMMAAMAGSLLVLPDGGGLARFAKFPGAPLMTVLIVVLLVRHVRLPAAALAPRRNPAQMHPAGTVSRAAPALPQPQWRPPRRRREGR